MHHITEEEKRQEKKLEQAEDRVLAEIRKLQSTIEKFDRYLDFMKAGLEKGENS